MRHYEVPTNPVAKVLFNIVTSEAFDWFIMGAILVGRCKLKR